MHTGSSSCMSRVGPRRWTSVLQRCSGREMAEYHGDCAWHLFLHRGTLWSCTVRWAEVRLGRLDSCRCISNSPGSAAHGEAETFGPRLFDWEHIRAQRSKFGMQHYRRRFLSHGSISIRSTYARPSSLQGLNLSSTGWLPGQRPLAQEAGMGADWVQL